MQIAESKLAKSVFFVDATSTEQYFLWKENYYKKKDKYDWKEDSMGVSVIIGHLNDNPEMPINVTFSFADIEGYKICFYDAVSRFVDHEKVKNFIIENYKATQDNMTDAMNFHHVYQMIDSKKNDKITKSIGIEIDGEIKYVINVNDPKDDLDFVFAEFLASYTDEQVDALPETYYEGLYYLVIRIEDLKIEKSIISFLEQYSKSNDK